MLKVIHIAIRQLLNINGVITVCYWGHSSYPQPSVDKSWGESQNSYNWGRGGIGRHARLRI